MYSTALKNRKALKVGANKDAREGKRVIHGWVCSISSRALVCLRALGFLASSTEVVSAPSSCLAVSCLTLSLSRKISRFLGVAAFARRV